MDGLIALLQARDGAGTRTAPADGAVKCPDEGMWTAELPRLISGWNLTNRARTVPADPPSGFALMSARSSCHGAQHRPGLGQEGSPLGNLRVPVRRRVSDHLTQSWERRAGGNRSQRWPVAADQGRDVMM